MLRLPCCWYSKRVCCASQTCKTFKMFLVSRNRHCICSSNVWYFFLHIKYSFLTLILMYNVDKFRKHWGQPWFWRIFDRLKNITCNCDRMFLNVNDLKNVPRYQGYPGYQLYATLVPLVAHEKESVYSERSVLRKRPKRARISVIFNNHNQINQKYGYCGTFWTFSRYWAIGSNWFLFMSDQCPMAQV